MRNVLVIAGPTASGKSGLALDLAQRHNGVVINADSMQVYDSLPLLTAQPPKNDLQKAPHVLFGILHPNDACTAQRWRAMALEEIAKAHDQRRLPIVTGGTGFYLKALLEGMSPIPDVPAGVREKMMAWQKELGNPAFHAELVRRDPKTAAGLDPLNTQRVVRAMEVLEHTGQGLADWQEAPREKPPAHLVFHVTTLLPEREALYRNCNLRFGLMLEAGALEEAAAFMKRTDVAATASLSKALGYPELAAHLRRETTLEEAIEAARAATRHYAKRQMTWFRHQLAAGLVIDTPDAGRVAASAGI